MNLPADAVAVAPISASIVVRIEPGVSDEVDRLAAAVDPDHAFLCAAWFRAGGADATVVATTSEGVPLAAIPTTAAGPAALGARAVVGAYWPFRTVLVAPELDAASFLRDRRTRAALGPLWRMGPFYEDDPAGSRLIKAAAEGGWTVLVRELGNTFLLDIAGLQAAEPWPRPSTLKRIRNYERQLGRQGEVSFERISGRDWSPAVFDTLAQVETASWIASRTDGSGAKFLNVEQRSFWEGATADPALASMMSALILHVGAQPVAFCFDLNVGTLQYSIAGSFDERFARLKPGKIATYRNIDWALERGITRIDWGAGDGGYKREIGATKGPRIVDCLFVRNSFVAGMLRNRWGQPTADGAGDDARRLPLNRREMLLLASILTAAAAGALAE